jgi:two-component system, NarL family, nitrate/nitrite response regulator NarL
MALVCDATQRIRDACGVPEPSRNASAATVVVDRCPLFREGLAEILGGAGFRVVASAADVAEAADAAEAGPGPALVILVSAGGGAGDLAAVQAARARFAAGAIVLLRQECPPQEAALILRAGASAILPVPTDTARSATATFVTALELVLLGQRIVPAHLIGGCIGGREIAVPPPREPAPRTGQAGLAGAHPALSAREVEILRYLLNGEPNRGIAQHLTISEATVKVHVKTILRKIKVKNRTQAAIWALNHMAGARAQAPLPAPQRGLWPVRPAFPRSEAVAAVAI